MCPHNVRNSMVGPHPAVVLFFKKAEFLFVTLARTSVFQPSPGTVVENLMARKIHRNSCVTAFCPKLRPGPKRRPSAAVDQHDPRERSVADRTRHECENARRPSLEFLSRIPDFLRLDLMGIAGRKSLDIRPFRSRNLLQGNKIPNTHYLKNIICTIRPTSLGWMCMMSANAIGPSNRAWY